VRITAIEVYLNERKEMEAAMKGGEKKVNED
jgi:hypothetical protein